MLSWLWGSKPSAAKVTGRDKAVLDVKRQRDKIKQYQKRIGAVIVRERELAKQCLSAGDRKRALLFLRKEKFQRNLMAKTDEQLATLEDLVASIEFAQIQADVAFGLKEGSQVLKELNTEMSLAMVDKIMDESAEGIAYQEELSASLSELISAADEADVERELEEIEQLERDKSAPIPEMPQVPTQLPATEQKNIEPVSKQPVVREHTEAILN